MTDSSSQPTELCAGPLRLKLSPSPRGPMIDQDRDDAERLSSLFWVMGVSAQSLKDGEEDELFDATQSGASYFDHVLEVRPVKTDDDLDAARAFWRKLTGAELEGALRLIQVASDPPVILPLEVLSDAMLQLRQYRAAHACASPWLFTPKAQWDYASPEERFALRAVEEKYQETGRCDDAALVDAGLRCTDRMEQKLATLLDWDARWLAENYATFLGECGALDARRRLFTDTPSSDAPHPMARSALESLEREATAIDEDEAALGGQSDPSALIRRRAAFHAALEAHGLLSEWCWMKKSGWLKRWGLAKLSMLYSAANAAWTYQRSDARRRYNADAPVTSLRAMPVCLDLFREGAIQPPPNVQVDAWISWGEHLLRTHGPGSDVTADQGDFPYHDKDGLIVVLWRKDAGVPALRYLSLQKTN